MNLTLSFTFSGLIDFQWLGSTFCAGVMEPEEQKEHQVQVCIGRPGVFDINKWRLMSSYDTESEQVDKNEYSHLPNTTTFITVLDGKGF